MEIRGVQLYDEALRAGAASFDDHDDGTTTITVSGATLTLAPRRGGYELTGADGAAASYRYGPNDITFAFTDGSKEILRCRWDYSKPDHNTGEVHAGDQRASFAGSRDQLAVAIKSAHDQLSAPPELPASLAPFFVRLNLDANLKFEFARRVAAHLPTSYFDLSPNRSPGATAMMMPIGMGCSQACWLAGLAAETGPLDGLFFGLCCACVISVFA
jgi:hypothetical protein